MNSENRLLAPNTLIAYLYGDGPTTALRRLVLRGPCNEEQAERLCRALSDGRYFAGGIVGADHGDGARATCELVAITQTLAAPSGECDVEGFIAQLEWAAVNGLAPRAGGYACPGGPGEWRSW